MASKRDLKKQIRFVCGETALTCIFTRDFMKVNDENKLDEIIISIAGLQSKALGNLNFSFDHQPKDFANRAEYRKALGKYNKAAYASFIKEFNNKMKEIVKEINEQLTPDQREENVKAAADKK